MAKMDISGKQSFGWVEGKSVLLRYSSISCPQSQEVAQDIITQTDHDQRCFLSSESSRGLVAKASFVLFLSAPHQPNGSSDRAPRTVGVQDLRWVYGISSCQACEDGHKIIPDLYGDLHRRLAPVTYQRNAILHLRPTELETANKISAIS